MALKKVKTEAGGGGKNGSRWVTREEAKTGARRIRREDDKAETDCVCDSDGKCLYHSLFWQSEPQEDDK